MLSKLPDIQRFSGAQPEQTIWTRRQPKASCGSARSFIPKDDADESVLAPRTFPIDRAAVPARTGLH